MAALDAVGYIVCYMTLGDEVDERRLPMRTHAPTEYTKFRLTQFTTSYSLPKILTDNLALVGL